MLREDEYLKLTCFLHVKTVPLDVKTIKLSDLWGIIAPLFGLDPLNIAQDELYIDALIRNASAVSTYHGDEVFLENKILVAMAIRLKTELFLESVLLVNGYTNFESTGVQTREWSNLANQHLSPKQKEIIDSVNLMTPESIHLNSFMYEPIIDMSDWMLKKLYTDVLVLHTFV